MIIWSGWGILAPVVAVLVGGSVALLLGGGLESAGMTRWVGLGPALGCLAGAAAVWWVGRWLNGRPGRELVDPRTGERVLLRPSHRLFFIPMQWWAVPLVVIGLFVLVATVLGATGALPPSPGATGTPKT